MSILPSYSPREAYSAAWVAPAQRDVTALSPVAVSANGFIRHCPLSEILARHLAHMAAAVTALRLTKGSVSLCLSEETTYIRPPWSRNRQTSEAFALKDGMGVRSSSPSFSGPLHHTDDRRLVHIGCRARSRASSTSSRPRIASSRTSASR